jgi:ATP-dependent Clp protease ATP-binding subunit ClpA
MWQRFTERARRVVFFAQEEATRLGVSEVGSDHLLLGLLRESDSVAARILNRLNVPQDQMRDKLERRVIRGDGRLGQNTQLTAEAKRAIELAFDEVRALNNKYLGTEHLLLGLIRHEGSLAASLLAASGVDLERARAEVRVLQDNDSGMPQDPKAHVLSEATIHELFALSFNALPAEQRDALLREGLLLNQLRDPAHSLGELISLMLEYNVQNGVFVLDPKGNVRVNVTRSDGNAHFTVTAPVTFVANLLVKD